MCTIENRRKIWIHEIRETEKDDNFLINKFSTSILDLGNELLFDKLQILTTKDESVDEGRFQVNVLSVLEETLEEGKKFTELT